MAKQGQKQGGKRGSKPSAPAAPVPDSPTAAPAKRDKRGRPLPPAFVGQQFKPGQTGNPKGRPPTRGLSRILRELGRAPAPDAQAQTVRDLFPDVEVITVEHVIAAGVLRAAMTVDYDAVKVFADRTEGKPRQVLEIEERPPHELDDAELAELLEQRFSAPDAG